MHDQEVKRNPQQMWKSRPDLQDRQIEIDQLRFFEYRTCKNETNRDSTHHEAENQAPEIFICKQGMLKELKSIRFEFSNAELEIEINKLRIFRTRKTETKEYEER